MDRQKCNAVNRAVPHFSLARLGLLAICVFLVSSMFAASQRSTSGGSKPVHVGEYTRKDGTVVHAHDRAAPGTAEHTSTTHTLESAHQPESTGTQTVPPKESSGSAGKSKAPLVSDHRVDGEIERDSRGRIARSAAAKARFADEHPCPVSNLNIVSCPGYVIDHIKPLACGGADAPANMQWQTEAAAKMKDKTERIGCSAR